MASRWRSLHSSKTIAGLGLVGLGGFILSGSLANVASQASRLIGMGADATQVFGELTVVGLAAAQLWRSYVFDRRELVLGVCRILISFWPLLLVIAGAVLTGMASGTMPKNVQNKMTEDVDLTEDHATRQ
jgi:hypothetical protein